MIDATAIELGLGADFVIAVFTPDLAEIERIQHEYESLAAFVRETGGVVVSKDAEDVVIDGEDRWTNEVGTPAMTVAGTGDTVAGIVGSPLRRGLDPVEAVRLGTWIGGRAGVLAAEERGTGMLATDVIDQIPAAVWEGRSDQ